MSLIVLIANQKGGVGKTTTAVNLATALAAIKKRVLLIDLDPQSNATSGLGIYSSKHGSSYDLLIQTKNLSEIMVTTEIPGLTLVPSNVNLIGAEIELVQVPKREQILKKSLDPYHDMFDYVVIDSPPSMGILTLNGLVASNGIVVPLQCEYYAMEGLNQLINSVKRVRAVFNPTLQIFGVLLTMYDRRNALSLSVENDVRNALGIKVFNTVIPRNVKISEAPSYGKPVLIYDVKSTGSRSYMELAREFLENERKYKWRRN